MVINLRLVDATPMDPATESMGRSWYGYDPACTDIELWAQNRGRYSFNAANIEAEQFASLSYRGEIVVVAELEDPCWEPFEDYERGIMKKALIGTVLAPGDAAYDALIGRAVPNGRGFTYLEHDDLDLQGTADRPASQRSPAGNSGQRWAQDPIRRKLVEDAAQDRLMEVYRLDGWEVTDTRHGNPYDARARRGDEVVYLEAKGTQSASDNVLVTAGEVRHAAAHPGQCVMGVLSEISFTSDGAIDPNSGAFRMFAFEPQPADLAPTGYTWTLPAG